MNREKYIHNENCFEKVTNNSGIIPVTIIDSYESYKLKFAINDITFKLSRGECTINELDSNIEEIEINTMRSGLIFKETIINDILKLKNKLYTEESYEQIIFKNTINEILKLLGA